MWSGTRSALDPGRVAWSPSARLRLVRGADVRRRADAEVCGVLCGKRRWRFRRAVPGELEGILGASSLQGTQPTLGALEPLLAAPLLHRPCDKPRWPAVDRALSADDAATILWIGLTHDVLVGNGISD